MPRNKLNVFVTIILLSACAGFLSFVALRKPEIKNINSRGENIICFGDSITWGYGVGRGEDYPSELVKMLDYPVINAGIASDTTAKALARFDADVLERDPLLVIIEMGANDFMRKIPMEATIKNMSEMIDKAQARGIMVAVADISAGPFFREYRVAFRKLAGEKKAILVPSLLSGILTNPSMKSDFIHPNRAGYKIIAQRVYRAVIPHLNKNNLLRQAKR